MARHPIQPLEMTESGVIRFKGNAIVRHLLDHGGIDLNKIGMLDFSREDREQFAQLIGYSHSGAGDLSYFSDETWAAARAVYDEGKTELPMETHYFTFGQTHMANVSFPNGGRLADYWVAVEAESYHREHFIGSFTSRYCPRPMQFAMQYVEEDFEPTYFPGGEIARITVAPGTPTPDLPSED